MSCFNPILALSYGPNPEDPKKLKVKMLPRRVDFNLAKAKEKYGDSLLLLPCGKCLGCASDYSKAWADRIVMEASLYEHNSFITLTYENAPEFPKKEDVQFFIRSLRDAHPDIKIRFFAVGELGEVSKRSHYHLIIFNYDFPDKKEFFKSGDNQIYRSKELEKLWPFGLSSIGNVSMRSASYTAQYSLKKKITGQNKGEFVMMSTHPGIGYDYFQKHKNEIFLTDSCYCKLAPGQKLTIPRYFRKLADKDQVIVPGYDRFLSKIRNGMKDNSKHGVRSVEWEEECLQIDEILANRVQRSRSKV